MGEYDGHRDRLRKKFLEHGLDVFSDHEVLELLLFYALPRRDTDTLARALLKEFGSIRAVLDARPTELKRIPGIGDNAAVLLQLMTPLARRYQLSRELNNVRLATTADCGKYLMPYFFGCNLEQIYLLCLDVQCRVISCRLLEEGTQCYVSLPIRRAAEIAIDSSAASVILAHNHPAGLALPSEQDLAATFKLEQTLKSLDIILVDHIIVAGNDFVSLRDSGCFVNT